MTGSWMTIQKTDPMTCLQADPHSKFGILLKFHFKLFQIVSLRLNYYLMGCVSINAIISLATNQDQVFALSSS